MLVGVYACQNATLLEITCQGPDEQSNHFRHFCPEIIWSIEIHGDSVGYVLHTPCPEIYCLRLIDKYYENYAEILCVIVSRNFLSTFNR